MNDQHWGPSISADIGVIGGGTAGIGLVASLLKLKATLLPWFYRNGMLKGREWLTPVSRVD
ncbi:FAD-dependent oxidoreductase [Pseudomonas sp. IT-196MI5]|uniref:hypothetical protein n=1 Tax=unclassified Pseudomonas TaxID=196821 RepID=UPI0039E03802